MTLPPDIESYRKFQRFLNQRVPAEIEKRWSERIIANELHLFPGEKGAEAYLDRFGRTIGEEKAMHLAIKAENEGYPEMAEGFWKKAFSLKSDESTPKVKKSRNSITPKKAAERARMIVMKMPGDSFVSAHYASATILKSEDKRSLREWWHQILRTHGRYSCYGIFLTLPSDEQVLGYLTEYGKELNLISSKNCLVIALGKTDFQRPSFDEGSWKKLVKEQTSEGYSVTVADVFGIKYTDFPCLLFFQDIRLPGHIAIKLQGLTTEEIALKMRLMFTTVDNAIRSNKRPLDELKKQQGIELLQQKSQLVTNKVSGLVEKTFEKAIEAWFNSIKSP